MTASTARHRPGRFEFSVLISMIMALSALAIDMMLPAFGEVRDEFGLAADSTAPAAIVTFFFLGLAAAQMFYGPLADRFGRKPVLYFGLSLYAISAVVASLAPTLGLILAVRFVWGVGAAAPRVVALSIVRDTYRGDQMARAMSFIMSVFVLVPIVAPSLGALILGIAPWRWVFGACAVAAASVALWSMRLPETLDPANRLDLHLGSIAMAARTVVGNRQTLGYTLALTFLFGVFMSYLASSELIISDVFDRSAQFPLIFGANAAIMGATMLGNAVVVARIGVRRLVHGIVLAYLVGAAGIVALAVATGGKPPFWLYSAFLALLLAMHGLAIPNFNTLAMDPMGRVAGTAAAIIGTVSTALGAGLGAILDRGFNGTVTPFSLGFLVYGIIAFGFVLWAEHGRLFAGTPARAAAD